MRTMLRASAKAGTDRPPKDLSPRVVSRIAILLLSMILLIPCFWQRRIQAGDLASHIYNSWLAQQIHLGKAPGLTLAPLTSNVLFDLALRMLFQAFAAEAAQRISVSAAALSFFWGAFALVSGTSGLRP